MKCGHYRVMLVSFHFLRVASKPKVTLEKYIKSIESIERYSTFEKSWKDIDAFF